MQACLNVLHAFGPSIQLTHWDRNVSSHDAPHSKPSWHHDTYSLGEGCVHAWARRRRGACLVWSPNLNTQGLGETAKFGRQLFVVLLCTPVRGP